MELREQNELIKDELLEWSDLESELKKLHQEMQVAIQEKDGAVKNLQTINEHLLSYVSSLTEKLQKKNTVVNTNL